MSCKTKQQLAQRIFEQFHDKKYTIDRKIRRFKESGSTNKEELRSLKFEQRSVTLKLERSQNNLETAKYAARTEENAKEETGWKL